MNKIIIDNRTELTDIVNGCNFEIGEINTLLTSLNIAKANTHESLPGHNRIKYLESKLEDIIENYYNR